MKLARLKRTVFPKLLKLCTEALERAKGIEPSTYSLGSCRSTTELRPRRRQHSTGAAARRKAAGQLVRCGPRESLLPREARTSRRRNAGVGCADSDTPRKPRAWHRSKALKTGF